MIRIDKLTWSVEGNASEAPSAAAFSRRALELVAARLTGAAPLGSVESLTVEVPYSGTGDGRDAQTLAVASAIERALLGAGKEG
jgi:hypothetical protein